MIKDNVTLDANSLLQQYGGANKNMLENIINAFVQDENELNIIQHSPYYSIEELPGYLNTDKKTFNILSLNVNSLLSKIDQLKDLLHIIEEQGLYLMHYVYKRVILIAHTQLHPQ